MVVCTAYDDAPTKARALTTVQLGLVLLSWICCLNSFVSPLHTAVSGTQSATFYWDHTTVSAPSVTLLIPTSCASGGKGFLAFMIFSFLFTTFSLLALLLRMCAVRLPIAPTLWHAAAWETRSAWFAAATTLLSVSIWGGACFTPSRDNFDSTAFKDFGFAVAATFFLVLHALLSSLVLAYAPHLYVGHEQAYGDNALLSSHKDLSDVYHASHSPTGASSSTSSSLSSSNLSRV